MTSPSRPRVCARSRRMHCSPMPLIARRRRPSRQTFRASHYAVSIGRTSINTTAVQRPTPPPYSRKSRRLTLGAGRRKPAAPSMPMATLTNTQPVGPIARIGRARRTELVARCGGSPTAHYVLISLGGIPAHLDMRRWPRQAGAHWIVHADWHMARADMTAYEELGLDFVDVLCSADLLLTKPGYGSFAEAACNGVPVLYVPRKTWPEAPYLECWLTRRGRCVPISWEQLERGDLSDALARLLAMAPTPPIAATGMDEAGDHLLRLLGASHSSSSEPTAP